MSTTSVLSSCFWTLNLGGPLRGVLSRDLVSYPFQTALVGLLGGSLACIRKAAFPCRRHFEMAAAGIDMTLCLSWALEIRQQDI